jgi:hypothetical protein
VARAHGLEAANCLLYADDVVSPPPEVRHFMSGERERALRPRRPEVSGFLAGLFHLIQQGSPTRVALAGWDLYHGHVFLHVPPTTGGQLPLHECDLGVLFHAKVRSFPSPVAQRRAYSIALPLNRHVIPTSQGTLRLREGPRAGVSGGVPPLELGADLPHRRRGDGRRARPAARHRLLDGAGNL